MRANRESIDIMASFLEVASHGSSSTEILKTANLSWSVFKKYRKYALRADFLCLSNNNYEVTKEGQLFLQNYKEISQDYIETVKILDQLTNERNKLTMTFLKKNKKSQPFQSMKSEPEPIVEFQVKDLKSDLQRLDAKKYYDELVILGFKPKDATEIITWLNIINRSNPTVFSGKKISLIKACLAYANTRISHSPSYPPRTLARRKIAQYFGTTVGSIQISYKKYVSIIQESQKKEALTAEQPTNQSQ
jgi:predicted transcriptional regulator